MVKLVGFLFGVWTFVSAMLVINDTWDLPMWVVFGPQGALYATAITVLVVAGIISTDKKGN